MVSGSASANKNTSLFSPIHSVQIFMGPQKGLEYYSCGCKFMQQLCFSRVNLIQRRWCLTDRSTTVQTTTYPAIVAISTTARIVNTTAAATLMTTTATTNTNTDTTTTTTTTTTRTTTNTTTENSHRNQ